MRKLTIEEKGIVEKVAARAKKVKVVVPDAVKYVHNGNYTIATVSATTKAGTAIFVGISKRNPTDKYDKAIGESLALVRAVRSQAVCVV